MINFQANIEKHTWTTIRSTIKKALPAFACIIDALDPPDSHHLYLVQYPYGATISDKGIFYLPNSERKLVPIHHSSIQTTIKDELGYSGTIPLGVVTANGIESFLQLKHKIIPGTFKGLGELISLWRVLEEENSSYHLNWTITS